VDVKYTIKDNFLNQIDFEKIRNHMLGDEFPWYFQEGVSHPGKHKDHFGWNHRFFEREEGILSDSYKILDPLLKKLKAKSFLRIKGSLHSNQGKIVHHENHIDYPFKHKGALFSLNTCNGFTTLKDNTKIKSVANRLLLFDPSLPHHSSTCTDAKVRCNININYF
tara:strand:+ start:754 stop:1248 length:495 start_codon:yes stop_codon:yes gene_type:complete